MSSGLVVRGGVEVREVVTGGGDGWGMGEGAGVEVNPVGSSVLPLGVTTSRVDWEEEEEGLLYCWMAPRGGLEDGDLGEALEFSAWGIPLCVPSQD
ncbi:hypothetical protein [Spirulina subsalsa]|uniref:hypothetical protein n=1 Tax=Spirulina subsalsa TaxID=54311 RepID=UPI0002F5E37B|nr:hypothetical protein [Spirulina subsalsa]